MTNEKIKELYNLTLKIDEYDDVLNAIRTKKRNELQKIIEEA